MADKLRPLPKHRRAINFVTTRNGFCRDIKPAMTDQPDYTVRAIHADEQAERAVSPGLSDKGARRGRKSSRTLARQQTEINIDASQCKSPKIEDRNT